MQILCFVLIENEMLGLLGSELPPTSGSPAASCVERGALLLFN